MVLHIVCVIYEFLTASIAGQGGGPRLISIQEPAQRWRDHLIDPHYPPVDAGVDAGAAMLPATAVAAATTGASMTATPLGATPPATAAAAARPLAAPALSSECMGECAHAAVWERPACFSLELLAQSAGLQPFN